MRKLLNPKLAKLVTTLNDLQFHDGTTLGKKLKITRTAIWKMIQKLEEYQVALESVKGKGYALTAPLLLLDKQKIRAHLHVPQLELKLFESIDSTNTYLKTLKARSHSVVCLSEQQTQGRGRFNHRWHSPFAENIYLSLSYRFAMDVSALAGLSLVVSLSIARVLDEFCSLPIPVLLKWPNDLFYEGHKLGGNLLEIQAESNGNSVVIIGIGINVNMLHDSKHVINQSWTSLRQITGQMFDRNLLIARLLNQLFADIQCFTQQGLGAFLPQWQQRDYLWQKNIMLQLNQQTYQGIASGIDAQGCLLLQTADTVMACSSGETSLAKE